MRKQIYTTTISKDSVLLSIPSTSVPLTEAAWIEDSDEEDEIRSLERNRAHSSHGKRASRWQRVIRWLTLLAGSRVRPQQDTTIGGDMDDKSADEAREFVLICLEQGDAESAARIAKYSLGG